MILPGMGRCIEAFAWGTVQGSRLGHTCAVESMGTQNGRLVSLKSTGSAGLGWARIKSRYSYELG